MNSKIKIKMGQIEIEYEGSEEFLKEELPALLAAVSDLYNNSAPAMIEQQSNTAVTDPISASNVIGTTGTIAAKVGGSTGPDLAMAAAARLTFVLSKDTFTRKELLTEMQTATAYYKPSYSGNFSKILAQHVKDGKLMESAKNTFALSADSRKSIGAQLA